MSMYRYTTPTIPCKLTGVDFSRVDYVRIAVEGKDRVCDKLNEVLVREVPASEFDEEGVALVRLTQEETAAFKEGPVYMQCRIKFLNGSVLPTKKIKTTMVDVIDKVVI